MPVAFDAGQKGSGDNVGSLTISLTVGSGSDRALVVMCSDIGGTDYLSAGTCTWNGTSMGSPVLAKTDGGGNNMGWAWVLANPASGTHDVVITPTANAYIAAVVSAYTGVDQAAPVEDSDAAANTFLGNPSTLSIAGASGGMGVDFFTRRTSGATLAEGSGQTQISTDVSAALSTSGSSYKADATAMEWDHGGTGNGLHLALFLKQASGSTGSTATPAAGAATVSAAAASTAATTATAAAGAATVSAVGGTLVVLVSSIFKNNTGTALASLADVTVWVNAVESGALVVKLTGQATDGSGVLTAQDAAIVTGTQYRVTYRDEDSGDWGSELVTAT